MRYITLVLALTLLLACAARAQSGLLADYVARPDDSYGFEIRQETKIGSNRAFIVRMTSQTWQGMAWEHWLSIIVPENAENPDKAILLIDGGSSHSKMPDGTSRSARSILAVAAQCKAVVAVLSQVPNQPLFGDLHEDAAVSYTFEKFLKGEGDDWPLLLPMVKSAVRAMDTITAVTGAKCDVAAEKFLVLGASKRGWTTYLTGAVDQRVIAIAPMVFDALNLNPQMRQQVATYGGYSEKIHDYTDRHIQEQMKTEQGKRLTAIVDPYAHLDKLNIPKLVVLGTNDPFWTVDASSLYFADLPGEKHLYYESNAGHGLGPGFLPVLIAFTSAAMNEHPMPMIDWQPQPDGSLRVTWDGDNATAMLCQAHSETRDFRQATWQKQRIEGRGQCIVRVDEPEDGYTAYYVEVLSHAPGALPYAQATTITVTPSTFPYQDKVDASVEVAGQPAQVRQP